MKIKYNLLAALALVGVMTSCNDDATNGIPVYKLDLSAAQTSIPAKGGAATVTATLPITAAYAADNWLTVNVEGNTLTATAALNPTRESRHTTVVLKSSERDSALVDVDQDGMVFVVDAPSTIVYNNKATTAEYGFNTNVPVTLSASDSWITPTYDNGALTISTTANTTGHIRMGYIYYSAGETTDSILVKQGDLSNIVNKYYVLGGTDPESGEATGLLAAIVKDDKSYVLAFPQYGWSTDVTLDASTLTLSLAGGSYLGPIALGKTTYYTYVLFGSSTAGYITMSPNVTFDAPFYWDEENGTFAIFEDNGSWSRTVDEICFGAFIAEEATGDNYAGDLMDILDPYLVEYTEEEGAKVARAAKARATRNIAGAKNFKLVRPADITRLMSKHAVAL